MNSFATSLKPILVLMNIFGVRLDSNERDAGKGLCRTRCIPAALGSVFLILNVSFSAFSVFHEMSEHFPIIIFLVLEMNHEQFSRIELADLISNLYRHFLVSSVPIIFTFHLHLTGQWKDLWATLKLIQEEMKLTEKFYRQCRLHCCCAILLLIAVGRAQVIILSKNVYRRALKFHESRWHQCRLATDMGNVLPNLRGTAKLQK